MTGPLEPARPAAASAATPAESLTKFIGHTVLPAFSFKLWLTLGLILLSLIGLVFEQEVFPHVPRSVFCFRLLLLGAVLLLPWLVAATARRIRQGVHGFFWRLFWQLAAVGAYALGALLLLPGLVATAWLLGCLLEYHDDVSLGKHLSGPLPYVLALPDSRQPT